PRACPSARSRRAGAARAGAGRRTWRTPSYYGLAAAGFRSPSGLAMCRGRHDGLAAAGFQSPSGLATCRGRRHGALSPAGSAGATPGGRPLPRGAWSSRTAGAVRLPRDLHHLVVLDHVAFLDVVEVLQPDAALVAGRHGPDVVLEAAQRLDATVVYDHAVA